MTWGAQALIDSRPVQQQQQQQQEDGESDGLRGASGALRGRREYRAGRHPQPARRESVGGGAVGRLLRVVPRHAGRYSSVCPSSFVALRSASWSWNQCNGSFGILLGSSLDWGEGESQKYVAVELKAWWVQGEGFIFLREVYMPEKKTVEKTSFTLQTAPFHFRPCASSRNLFCCVERVHLGLTEIWSLIKVVVWWEFGDFLIECFQGASTHISDAYQDFLLHKTHELLTQSVSMNWRIFKRLRHCSLSARTWGTPCWLFEIVQVSEIGPHFRVASGLSWCTHISCVTSRFA